VETGGQKSARQNINFMVKKQKERVLDLQLILSLSLQKEEGSGRALLRNSNSVAEDNHQKP
jgi:hypothetical protein